MKAKTIDFNNAIKLYQNGYSLRHIAKIYNVTHGYLSKYFKMFGVHVKSNIESWKKHYCNNKIFDNIDTEDKAYWLGFITADGGIYRKSLDLCLSVKDIDHLQKYKRFINYDGDIYINNKYHYARVRIHDVYLVKSLEKYGIVERKTFKIFFPNIDESLYHHFIRGYFDGDGSIHISKRKNRKSASYGFEIMGTHEMLNTISNILYKFAGISYVIPKPKNGLYRIIWGGRGNIIKLYKYLYNNTSIYLDRKKEIFEKINNGIIYL